MRLEINIPDTTRLEVKERLVALTQSLNENPELVEDLCIREDGDAMQAFFTEERIAEIDRALASVAAGNFYTEEEVDKYFTEKEAEWISQND